MHHNSTDRKKHQGSTQESVHAVYTCVPAGNTATNTRAEREQFTFSRRPFPLVCCIKVFLTLPGMKQPIGKQASESCLPENSQRLEKQSSETI